jgi:F-type H+-transporting ATPase subunit a
MKSFSVAAFSVFTMFFFLPLFAQEGGEKNVGEKKAAFNTNEVIFGHILDAHEFHFFDLTHKDGSVTPVGIPLPVILYSPQRGFDIFMSSKFHHGEHDHAGYRLLNGENLDKLKEHGYDLKKEGLSAGKIIAIDENGNWDKTVKFYDISLSRNVVQMIIALILLVWVMITIAKRYQKGEGVNTAPKGMQSLLEPIIIFVRDDIVKPNLGDKWEKYLPYILTLFFFILINNIFGLIPGTANVTGNIAFTLVLAVIAFIVLLLSSKKPYWTHILNPPGVPLPIKFILVPVEIMSLIVKPTALTIRLFANMVAGHIIIICLISLIFIFSAMNKAIGIGTSPLAVGFTVFIYFIEILVAFLQAYIFAMLTAVFVGETYAGEHHEESHAAH